MNKPDRVCEKFAQTRVAPRDVGVLHCGREIEAWSGAALAPDDAGKRRPDLVHTGLGCMANPQRAAKARCPAGASPAAIATGELPRIATATSPVLRNENFISAIPLSALCSSVTAYQERISNAERNAPGEICRV